MPTFDWNGEASTEVGSYGQINLFAAQNFTVIADKLALRVSAYDSKGDGYLTNSALFGIDANPSTDYGIRTSLLYKPSDDLSAQLILRYAYLRDGRDPYSLLGSVTSYTYDVQLFQPTWQERPTYGAILKVNDDLGPFQFTSISSFTQETIDFDFDVTLTPPGVPGLRLYTIRGNPPTQPITQEFRLTSPSGGTIDWLVGLYGDTIRNILAYPNKYDQVGVFPDTPPIVASDSDTRQSDVAVFGTLNYHLGSLTAGVGLRLNETKFKANVYVSPGATPNQANSITSRAALPKFSLSYFLPNGELLYADVAKGEQPGGVNTQSAIATAYEAETATSYEIGTKGQAMDRRFAYEAAAFYVRNANHQYQSNVFINGVLFQAITNIGLSRSYGTEANISWRPTPEISLHVGGGLLNAKWIRADYFGAAVDGKIIPNSPSATANIGAAYSRSVFNGLRADANVDMNYTGSLYWDIPNTAGSASPHYWLGDARIALGTNNGAWQVAFRVSNILGAKYWTEYYANFFPPPTPNIGAIGAPRQVMASVSVKW
jgi:iron complex outermembrane receptor protein